MVTIELLKDKGVGSILECGESFDFSMSSLINWILVTKYVANTFPTEY